MSIDYDKEFAKTLDDIKLMWGAIKESIRNGNKPSFKGKRNMIMAVLKNDSSSIEKIVKRAREIKEKR